MVIHKCTQESRIADLTFKTQNLMDIVKETNLNVKEIKAYIFEGGMENKYSTKEEVRQSKELQDLKIIEINMSVSKHQAIIDRLARAIIMGVLVFIGSAGLLVYSVLGK